MRKFNQSLSLKTCKLVASFALLTALSASTMVFDANAQKNAVPKKPSAQDEPVMLETETLSVKTAAGNFDFVVEIADEPEERMIGLMHRKKMALKHGMLFDFGHNSLVNMWMQNTVLSLDMIFIRQNGTVAKVAVRTTPFSEDIITSGEPVSHVLELNAGVAALIGLKKGDKISHRFFQAQ